jgi:hypothetical protein
MFCNGIFGGNGRAALYVSSTRCLRAIATYIPEFLCGENCSILKVMVWRVVGLRIVTCFRGETFRRNRSLLSSGKVRRQALTLEMEAKISSETSRYLRHGFGSQEGRIVDNYRRENLKPDIS